MWQGPEGWEFLCLPLSLAQCPASLSLCVSAGWRWNCGTHVSHPAALQGGILLRQHLGLSQRQRATSFRLQTPVGHGLGHISDTSIYLCTLKGQWPPGDSGGWLSTLGEKKNSASVWVCPALFPSGSWWCESKQWIVLLFTEVWTGRQ